MTAPQRSSWTRHQIPLQPRTDPGRVAVLVLPDDLTSAEWQRIRNVVESSAGLR